MLHKVLKQEIAWGTVPHAGHTDDVTAVAFSPDGTTLASGGFVSTILLWEIKSAVSQERTYNFFPNHRMRYENKDHNSLLGQSGLFLKLLDSNVAISKLLGILMAIGEEKMNIQVRTSYPTLCRMGIGCLG